MLADLEERWLYVESIGYDGKFVTLGPVDVVTRKSPKNSEKNSDSIRPKGPLPTFRGAEVEWLGQ